MAQVFGPGANSLARLTLGASVLGILLLFGALELYVRSPYVTQVGQPVDQPVPFSHKHHVTDDGIDCRYCHTTVETGAFAGIPPTQTCMNCHSQVWAQSPMLQPVQQSFLSGQPIDWNRVNNLPGFVYFNHSIHIDKGVGCSTCHGRVDQMPLMYKAESFQMSFCLDCHQNPAQFIRPRDQVFNMAWQPPPNQAELGRQLVQAYHVQSQISCSTCHR
ncbi:MAG TPA: cytochrome c3 family protein [Chloroflexota bacterium]|nr:cytochrome c3 family protein [Chloroflexota bacterium]